MSSARSTESLMVRTYTGATVMEADAASMDDLPAVRKEGYEVHSRSRAGTEVTVTYRRRGGDMRWRTILAVELIAAVVAAVILSAFVLAAIISVLGWWADISSSAYANSVVLLAIAFWLALANAIVMVADAAHRQEEDATREGETGDRRVATALTVALVVAVVAACFVTLAWLIGDYQFAEVPSDHIWSVQFGGLTTAASWALVYALWLFRAAERTGGAEAAELSATD